MRVGCSILSRRVGTSSISTGRWRRSGLNILSRSAQGRRERVGIARRLAGGQFKGITPGQPGARGCPRTVNIRTTVGPGASVLLRDSEARRARRGRVPGLSSRKGARDARIDHVKLIIWREHPVRRPDIAKDDRRLFLVQSRENLRELKTDLKRLRLVKVAARLVLLMLLQRLAPNVFRTSSAGRPGARKIWARRASR